MTDTANTAAHRPSYRAVTRNVRVWAACRGINHSDSGEIVTHDRCGAEVVRREDGRIFNVELSGFYGARKYSCYHGDHECDPALVAATDRARTQALSDGEVVKGATVQVVRGRKVPRGTVGRVAWIGDNGWGTRVGLAVEGETGLKYTAVGNVEVVDRPAAPAPAPAPAAANAPVDGVAGAIAALRELKGETLGRADEALENGDADAYDRFCDEVKAINAKIAHMVALYGK